MVLEKSVFVLSMTELGKSNVNAPSGEGSFISATSKFVIANTETGSAVGYWLRTLRKYESGYVFFVNPSGSVDSTAADNSIYYARPAFTLPADFLISDGTSPSQAIALQGGTAGQSIEVIYSGTVSADWVTAGQTITSDGVYGAGLLDGVLQVWGADRPNTVQIAVVSYVGTGRYGASNPLSITTEFPADVIIRVATSAEEANIENVFTCYNTYCTVIMSEVGEDWTRGIGFSSSESYITNTWSKKSADGRTLYWYGLNLSDCSNDSGRTYYYVAIKF